MRSGLVTGGFRRDLIALAVGALAGHRLRSLLSMLGIGGGLGLCAVLRMAVPGLPITTPLSFVAAAIGVSLVTGLASGVLPARRAAALDPIVALRAE